MSIPSTWFITGAGSGLGLELTKQLLTLGHHIAATTKANLEPLNKLQENYPEQIKIWQLDVTRNSQISHVVKSAFEHFGTIDTLVSNAGYILLGALEETTEAQIDLQINTNFRGSVFLVKEFLPYFRAQKHGKIIQMGSEGGQIAYPALTLYHATKWALEGFCESLAKEVAALNIQVMIVEPGRTATNFDHNAKLATTPIDAYRQSTVGQYFKLLTMGKLPNINDPKKVINQLIETVLAPCLPLRLTLGKDAYTHIHKVLQERLNALESQHDIACSTTFDSLLQAPAKNMK